MTDPSEEPVPARQRVAVVGSGIAGLAATLLLGRRHQVVLYEAADRLGGHSHTVLVDCSGRPTPVDTGFIVYNELNYPNLVALFAHLGVPSQPSDMSFSLSVDGGALEWAGTSLATVFAQPVNLLRPSFLRMLRDILRFNRRVGGDLAAGRLEGVRLGDYLAGDGYSTAFQRDYLLPMSAAIWSVPVRQMLDFPAATLARFFINHRLTTLNDRPQWRTVQGGSRTYVRRIAEAWSAEARLAAPVAAVLRRDDGVLVREAGGREQVYDQVVIAAHSDQALAMLGDPSADERRILGSIRYQPNRAVLHRDASLMPRRRSVWSSWNYLRRDGTAADEVCVTYWMNRLQSLDPKHPLFVTLNPLVEPRSEAILGTYAYAHPVFDAEAIAAQAALPRIQGRRRTWFCGAWCRYGFHEDGLQSAIAVALALGAPPAWSTTVPPAGAPADRPEPALPAAAD